MPSINLYDRENDEITTIATRGKKFYTFNTVAEAQAALERGELPEGAIVATLDSEVSAPRDESYHTYETFTGKYWLGNEPIYRITFSGTYSLSNTPTSIANEVTATRVIKSEIHSTAGSAIGSVVINGANFDVTTPNAATADAVTIEYIK